LASDEVGVEGRGQRIAAVAHVGDLGTGLAQQRVVHGRHQGNVRTEEFQHATDDGIEDALRIPSVSGEQAIVGRPVLVPFAGRPEQTGDRVRAQAGQLADGQDAGSMMRPLLGEDVHVLVPEVHVGVQEAIVFFYPSRPRAAESGSRVLG
jgi:hypothetical protein